MKDQYAWWRKALEIGGGRELSREQIETLGVAETDPQSGFFRRRAHKDGPYVPVAIWRGEGDTLICLEAGKQIEPDQVERIWTWCCRWPISETLYHQIMKGGAWPDEPPSAPKDHNQIKTGDPAEDLRAEFLAEKELADDFLKRPVGSQEDADKIAVWSKKISGIVSKANTAFKTEKQPWLDGGKNVDERWRWRQEGDALVKSLKRALDGWLRELDRREQERQRKAREEADRVRREAEEAAARASQQDGKVGTLFKEEAQKEADRLTREAEEREREAQARTTNAGRTGAKVSLRTFYEAKIVNYDALVMALKDEPEVREIIAKIANRIARTQGATMPAGAERIEEKRAA